MLIASEVMNTKALPLILVNCCNKAFVLILPAPAEPEVKLNALTPNVSNELETKSNAEPETITFFKLPVA